MENAKTYDAYLEALASYEELFALSPGKLACDMHPEYISTKWAHKQAKDKNVTLEEVQHHHAHIASAMAENGLRGPVCGIAFDGTGYGVDKHIWGGEVLLANLETFERFANFAYIPMPGGAACIKHPLRMAYGALCAFDLLEHPAAKRALESLGEQAQVCAQMIEQSINTPMTSSVGRLFDAASALLGICTEPAYEGEPAILLEAAAWEQERAEVSLLGNDLGNSGNDFSNNLSNESGNNLNNDLDNSSPYVIDIVKNVATAQSTAKDTSVVLLDAAPLFKALLDDMQAKVPLSVIARNFHDAYTRAIVEISQLVRALYEIDTVALSGGVFMNRYILEHALARLEKAGFTVAINRDLPPNDGCISFGQAVVARARMKR